MGAVGLGGMVEWVCVCLNWVIGFQECCNLGFYDRFYGNKDTKVWVLC